MRTTPSQQAFANAGNALHPDLARPHAWRNRFPENPPRRATTPHPPPPSTPAGRAGSTSGQSSNPRPPPSARFPTRTSPGPSRSAHRGRTLRAPPVPGNTRNSRSTPPPGRPARKKHSCHGAGQQPALLACRQYHPGDYAVSGRPPVDSHPRMTVLSFGSFKFSLLHTFGLTNLSGRSHIQNEFAPPLLPGAAPAWITRRLREV